MLFLQAGERVRIVGRLYAPFPPANPGGFDWARHLHRQGIDAALSTDHAAAVEVVARDSNTFTQAINAYRAWADHLLHQDSELIENNDHGAVSAMSFDLTEAGCPKMAVTLCGVTVSAVARFAPTIDSAPSKAIEL